MYYLLGRKVIDDELEGSYTNSPPIHSFALYRGCEGFFSQEMRCGTFKGYVSVRPQGSCSALPEMDFTDAFIEKKYTVRLYLTYYVVTEYSLFEAYL